VYNHSHGALRDTLGDNRCDILKIFLSFLTRIGCAIPIWIIFQSTLIFQLHVTELSGTLSLFYFHEYYDTDNRLPSSLSSLLPCMRDACALAQNLAVLYYTGVLISP